MAEQRKQIPYVVRWSSKEELEEVKAHARALSIPFNSFVCRAVEMAREAFPVTADDLKASETASQSREAFMAGSARPRARRGRPRSAAKRARKPDADEPGPDDIARALRNGEAVVFWEPLVHRSPPAVPDDLTVAPLHFVPDGTTSHFMADGGKVIVPSGPFVAHLASLGIAVRVIAIGDTEGTVDVVEGESTFEVPVAEVRAEVGREMLTRRTPEAS